jgi:predicted transcriptional regulator
MPAQSSAALERSLRLLGPLEGCVMRLVWSRQLRQPFVVRDVQPQMPELAYTTVMTTLNRLADKGLLSVTPVRGRRAHGYAIRLTPDGTRLTRSSNNLGRSRWQHSREKLTA